MARAKKATEAPTDPLDAMLARLQLSGIRDQLDSLLDEAARANLSARCQRAAESPQFWACNFPHFGGVGDQPFE